MTISCCVSLQGSEVPCHLCFPNSFLSSRFTLKMSFSNALGEIVLEMKAGWKSTEMRPRIWGLEFFPNLAVERLSFLFTDSACSEPLGKGNSALSPELSPAAECQHRGKPAASPSCYFPGGQSVLISLMAWARVSFEVWPLLQSVLLVSTLLLSSSFLPFVAIKRMKIARTHDRPEMLWSSKEPKC